LALRALALCRSLFEAVVPLVNVVTRALVSPVGEAVETSQAADDGRKAHAANFKQGYSF
jgi:hypothetical protein